MAERCILQKLTGYESCIMADHWFGEWGKEICCLTESQQKPPIMVLAALMEISQLDDPRLQRIIENLSDRGIAFDNVDDYAPADSRELMGYLTFSLKKICSGDQTVEEFNKNILDQFERIRLKNSQSDK